MKLRVDWIDIFKGITIVFMVIGHSWSPWTPYIYLFHMPAFLFISGYTNNYTKYNFYEYLKRKVITLLLPFIYINLFFIILRYSFKVFNLEKYYYIDSINIKSSIINFFLHLYTIDLGGATWFLFVLFLSSIISKLIYDVSSNNKFKNLIQFSVSILLYTCAYYLFYKQITLEYMIDLTLCGVFYFMLGTIFKEKKIYDIEINHAIAVPISIVVIFTFGYFFHPVMNWPTRSFSSPIVNFITSISGIYLLIFVSHMIQKNKFLNRLFIYIGQRTLAILNLHFVVFRIFFSLFYLFGLFDIQYLKELTPRANNNFWFLLTILTISLVLFIEKFAMKNKFLGIVLTGRSIKNNY